ncbi:helix-turn-helix domain-containing protein [uncultured Pedobacter sp.]|uniref:helix-turn-helix domain-containing protein n=1 Tax=uncultured Pedobacter sp. TaxID=246139 RepID=UPI00345C2E77
MDIITMEDLRQFKTELLQEMKGIIGQGTENQQNGEWLRSAQVRKMLNISPGTLQNLRINGTLPFRKVGGTMYYSSVQIEKILKGE